MRTDFTVARSGIMCPTRCFDMPIRVEALLCILVVVVASIDSFLFAASHQSRKLVNQCDIFP